MKTLLLDETYFPVEIIDWRRSLTLFFTGRVQVLENHDDIDIRSASSSIKLPKVIKLITGKKFQAGEVRFNRYNIFYRDHFTCQYCGVKGNSKNLTFDHVIPRSKGGDTSWENIVTACQSCNSKKGSKLLTEWGVKLKQEPMKPKWTPSMTLRMKEEEHRVFGHWVNSLSYKFSA